MSFFDKKRAFSSKKDEWETPQYIYDKLHQEFDFTLDPCASKENAKCKKFYTIEDDGLKQDWSGERVFMNPPYGRYTGRKSVLEFWVKKAYEESLKYTIVVCLIPARTDTLYWHDYIFPYAAQIRFIKRRVRFIGDGKLDNAPFASAVVLFNRGFSESVEPFRNDEVAQCLSVDYR